MIVDTSQAGFITTPLYICAIAGDSHHWEVTGGSAIYEASPTSFRIYVRYPDGRPVTPADANNMGWHINWIGMQL